MHIPAYPVFPDPDIQRIPSIRGISRRVYCSSGPYTSLPSRCFIAFSCGVSCQLLLVAVHIRFVSAFGMSPDYLIQHFKYHIRRYLIFWRVFLWLIQQTHSIIPEHLETSEESRVSIKASASTKAWNGDDGHLQSCIFT